MLLAASGNAISTAVYSLSSCILIANYRSPEVLQIFAASGLVCSALTHLVLLLRDDIVVSSHLADEFKAAAVKAGHDGVTTGQQASYSLLPESRKHVEE